MHAWFGWNSTLSIGVEGFAFEKSFDYWQPLWNVEVEFGFAKVVAEDNGAMVWTTGRVFAIAIRYTDQEQGQGCDALLPINEVILTTSLADDD